MINTSNPIKGIMLYKCENIISKKMKRFQVKENNPHVTTNHDLLKGPT